MSHLHFGRAVPVTFRRFPSLVCHNLLGTKVRVPQDLEGRSNILVVGFKTSHYWGMNTWMPFASQLKKDLLSRHNIEDPVVQVYRLIIRQRGGALLRWWTDERLRLAIGDGTFENGDFPVRRIITNEDQEGPSDPREAAGGPAKAIPANVSDTSDAGSEAENAAALRASSVRSRTLVSFTSKSAFVEALQLADAQRVYIFLVDKQGEIAWCEHEAYSPAKVTEIREILRLPTPGGSYLPQAPKNAGLLTPDLPRV